MYSLWITFKRKKDPGKERLATCGCKAKPNICKCICIAWGKNPVWKIAVKWKTEQ